MAASIRKATPEDASQWLELLGLALGTDYPARQVYEAEWAARQLSPGSDVETWVVADGSKLIASASFLPPLATNQSPIANLGRIFMRPEAHGSGADESLFQKLNELTAERGQSTVSRVSALDQPLQVLHEKAGFHCAGFQPFKHMNRVREGILFYVRLNKAELGARLSISESLPQVSELAVSTLSSFGLEPPRRVRDGAVGYPLQTEVKVHETKHDDFLRWRPQTAEADVPPEISGAFNLGFGSVRAQSGDEPLRALLATRDDQVVAGVAFYFDPIDRCVRIINSFCLDDLSMGAVLHQISKVAHEQFSAIYIETDILVTAPRMLRSAEQVGFVPVAYLPAFFNRDGALADVVKMVKLNMVYSPESASFTPGAQKIAEIVDCNFQDQKVGVAIINLLRTLPIFEGLGDGELRKIARLFTQKLYRPGEKIFNKGDTGSEAYVVMRGQVDIVLDSLSKPIASIGNGQIFGELAFLDGAARGAIAIASQPSILLVIQRSAFNLLAQQEPHLGMVVTRNIAIELSNRLRRTNAAVSTAKN